MSDTSNNQIKTQLEEIRIKKNIEYNKKLERKLLEEKEQCDKEQHDKEQCDKEQHEKEQLEKLNNNFENLRIKKHQEYLDGLSEKHDDKIKIPVNHLEYINDSFVIIYSIFEEKIEEFNTQNFVQNNILDKFYQQILISNLNNLYTFYVSIKEISSTYESVEIDLIYNIINLIKMDHTFVDILARLNELEYIKIIFQEFIKLIEHIRPEIYTCENSK